MKLNWWHIRAFFDWIYDGFKYPYWAYVLECEICQMSFLSSKNHYNYAKKLKKH